MKLLNYTKAPLNLKLPNDRRNYIFNPEYKSKDSNI